MSWSEIASWAAVGLMLLGYLHERRKSARAERRAKRVDDEDVLEAANHRIEIALLNMSDERDRMAEQNEKQDRLIVRLRREVDGFRQERAEAQVVIASLRTELVNVKALARRLEEALRASQEALKAATGGA